MLIALLTALLLVGGEGIDLFTRADEARVETVITDEARAKEIVTLMKATDNAASKQLARAMKILSRWSKADRDHSAGRDDLAPVLEELTSIRSTAQREFMDALFELRGKMSEQEWSAVFGESAETP